MRHLLLPLVLAAATSAGGAPTAKPPHIVFPDDPCVIDAKKHLGAKGDGKTDDTAALQAGLDLNFALRFTGWFTAPADGLYTFHTTSDDGSRLWIGDTLVVDNDGAHAAQTRSGRIALKAGAHPFTVGYQQGGDEFSLRV